MISIISTVDLFFLHLSEDLFFLSFCAVHAFYSPTQRLSSLDIIEWWQPKIFATILEE